MAEFINTNIHLDNPIFQGRRLYVAPWIMDGSKTLARTPEEYRPLETTSLPRATLISSLKQGIGNVQPHWPCIDIDIPFDKIKVMRSASGNCHLYINRGLTWVEYQKLLDVMAEVGLVERCYVEVSKKEGMTLLRLPGVPKVRTSSYGESEDE